MMYMPREEGQGLVEYALILVLVAVVVIAASLGGRTSVEWIATFEAADVPCGVVHTPDSVLDDPHLKEVGFFEPKFATDTGILRTLRQPVIFRGVDAAPDHAPPSLGADTRALLGELGYSGVEADALIDKRIAAASGQS